MSYADNVYKEVVNEIYKDGEWDKDSSSKVRTVYEDGKKAYSKGIFGKQILFPEGKLPLLTSKKVFWKTALKEMMIFWQYQSVKKEIFEKNNVKVWDEWFLEDGTLGKSYAYQFESNPKYETVNIETNFMKEKSSNLNKNQVVIEEDGTFKDLKDSEQYTIESVSGENLRVIKEIIDIGGIANNLKKQSFCLTEDGKVYVESIDNETGKSDNYYVPVEYKREWGNLYIHYSSTNSDLKEEDYDKVYNIWLNLIESGKVLADRWKVFDYFFEDIYYIPQYFLAKNSGFDFWNLTNLYHNTLLKSENKSLVLSRENAVWLSPKQLIKVFNFRWDNLLPKISENQVVNLLKTMKNFPNSRRLMTSFWNDSDIDGKALQECAWATDWRIRNGKLDLILIQRSGDIALGIPFNQIQYYLLQNMIAGSLGLKVGKFIHQIGDLHYYDRHEGILVEQVNNAVTYKEGELKITPRDFFDYSFKDIVIKNYESGKVHNYEVAI